MELRGIAKQAVEEILAAPQQKIAERIMTVFQSRIEEDDKVCLYLIFVDETVQPHSVVTVYKTSNIGKYYEDEV